RAGVAVEQTTMMRKLVSETKCKRKRVRLAVKAVLKESSSNHTPESVSMFPGLAGLVTDGSERTALSSGQVVYDSVMKQAAMLKRKTKSGLLDVKPDLVPSGTKQILNEAYERCGEICLEYGKHFYLGTLLTTPEQRRAIWAIYVWCSRVDELVDGPHASHITPKALDRWEKGLEDLFSGRPYDMLDAALTDTVAKFPVDIQPFRDMITGMRMDQWKFRYKSFDELFLYCYYVSVTVGLMTVPVLGIAPESQATTESVYNAVLALGIANQLTNILRDVGEDAQLGRIYLPQDELAQSGLSDEDIFSGKVTDKWRSFMKDQIRRARMLFYEAEKGITELDKSSRWPVWTSLMIYRQTLDAIEANDYNNFTKRAYVGKVKKLLTLPVAFTPLGIANKLTNILHDVAEDAPLRRIYLPQDELSQSGLSDEDNFSGKVTDKWRSFMKDQGQQCYLLKQKKISLSSTKSSRWQVWTSLIIYQQTLDAIEANDYDIFTKRAYVGKDTAYDWFLSMPPNSIRSWGDSENVFSAQFGQIDALDPLLYMFLQNSNANTLPLTYAEAITIDRQLNPQGQSNVNRNIPLLNPIYAAHNIPHVQSNPNSFKSYHKSHNFLHPRPVGPNANLLIEPTNVCVLNEGENVKKDYFSDDDSSYEEGVVEKAAELHEQHEREVVPSVDSSQRVFLGASLCYDVANIFDILHCSSLHALVDDKDD
ncbi:hypothetical protein KI387_032160, partial [Taxus chinensis]